MRSAMRLMLGLVLAFGFVPALSGCGGGDTKVQSGSQVEDAPPPAGVQTSGSQSSKPAP